MSYHPNYFNAVVIVQSDQWVARGLKYHNIMKSKTEKFEQFARGIPGAHHINYYEKKDGSFSHQVKLLT